MYLTILRDSLCVGSCYGLLYFILLFNKHYAKLDYSTRMYIVKNFVKSAILFYISLNSFSDLIPSIYYNEFDNFICRKYASLYVSNDIVALLVVKRLPITTKIHHSITTGLLFYSFNIDFNNEDNFGKLLVVYTLLSSFAFMVNFYLAARFFKKDEIYNRYIDKIRIYSYNIYALLCLINWIIHGLVISIKFYLNQIYLCYAFYCFILIFIINDDLILMSWLKKESIKE